MPNQVITQLIVDASGAKSGVADFEAAMKKAKDAAVDAGASTASSFDSAQRKWVESLGKTDPVIKAQIQMKDALARQEAINTRAVQLGITTQDAAAAQLAKVTAQQQAHVDAVTKANTALTTGEKVMNAFGKATGGVQGQLIALSAGAGPVGVFLSALGPWGLAAAAGIGLLASAFEEAKRTAELLATEANALQRFSEQSGLSTTTLQALTKAAAEHGVSAEDATAAIVRFTAAWAEAREGSGSFLTQMQKINPALADQIQRTKDSGEAFDILAKAIKQADAAGDIAQRNLLLRAAGGRGGVAALAGLANATVDAGGLQNLTKDAIDAGHTIDSQLLSEVHKLQVEIDETKKHADLLFGTIGAKSILEAELAWQKLRVKIAQTTAALAEAEKSKPFWEWYFEKLGQAANGAAGIGFSTEALKGQLDAFGQPALNQRPSYPPAIDLSGVAVPPPTKDIKAQLSDLREQITLLGSAATANDKLKLKLLELQAAVDANKTAENQLAAARGMSAAQLDAYIEKLQLHNAAMGAAASTTDLIAAKMATLQKQQQQGAGLTAAEVVNQQRLATEQANGTAAILSQADAYKVQAATIGLGVGAAASLSAQLQLLLQDQRNGKVTTEADTAARKAAADAMGEEAQKAAQLAAQNRADFDLQTAGLSGVEAQIAQVQFQLHGNAWQDFMNDGVAAAMRTADAMKTLNDAVGTVVKNLVTGIAQGQKLGDIITNTATSLGSKFIDKGVDNILSNPTSPVGYIEAGVGALMTAFGAKSAAQKQAEEQQQRAAKAWEDARYAADTFRDTLLGISQGTLQPDIQSKLQQESQFANLAHEAHGGDAQQDPSVIALQNAFNTYVGNTVANFLHAFGASVQQLANGLGPDSAFGRAAGNVKQLGDQVLAFVADTKYAIQQEAPNDLAQQALYIGAAQHAAVLYAGTLLDVKKQTSATADAIASAQGGATALANVFVQLGFSASDAAAIVQDKLNAALNQIKSDFVDQLNADINTAQGNGWLNDVQDLFKSFQDNLKSAAAVGLDTGKVYEWLAAKAQELIDNSHLTGKSLDYLIQVFPELSGQIHAFTARSADDITKLQQSYSDQLFGLLQDQNTLDGQLAVFNLAAQREREAEIAAGGEDLASLVALQEQKRYNIIKDWADKTAQATQQALDEATTYLTGALKTIKTYLDGLTAGSGSPLSPGDRLTAAQSQYNTQLALAQGGNRTALDQITQYASNLIDAAKGYFASSSGFQSIFGSVQSGLSALPTQLKPEEFIVNNLTTPINAVTSAVNAMNTSLNLALQTSINTGSASAIASALSAYFTSIDTNVNGLIDYNEMQTALHGMASDSALASMFKTLDTDNSGSISKLELLRAATADSGGVKSNTANTATSLLALAQIASSTSVTADNTLGVANNAAQSAATLSNISTSALGINNAATANLPWLLNIRNNLFTQNVNWPRGYNNTNTDIGHYATGGLFRGTGTGTSDSNLAHISNLEYIVNAASTSANLPLLEAINNSGGRPIRLPTFGFAANDNGWANVVAELRALRAEVGILRKVNERHVAVSATGLSAIVETGAKSKALEDENRALRRQPRAAAR